MFLYSDYQSPLGTLRLFFSEVGLRAVVFHSAQIEKSPDSALLAQSINKTEGIAPAETTDVRFARLKEELDSYFDGSLSHFFTPLDYENTGTAFQRRVWDALREIPYGKTATYGELAERIGNPKASRAVGLANNRNPLAIVIPCHRVIGANGSLVGYAGGLDFKRGLLRLEGVPLKSESDPKSSRAHILQAAVEEFVNCSYAAARVDHIAAAAGVNKRMIYHHFDSKKGLYDSILRGDEDIQIDDFVLLRLRTWQVLEDRLESEHHNQSIHELKATVTSLMQESGMNSPWSPSLVTWLLSLGEKLQRKSTSNPVASADDMLKLAKAILNENQNAGNAATLRDRSQTDEPQQNQSRDKLQAVLKRVGD